MNKLNVPRLAGGLLINPEELLRLERLCPAHRGPIAMSGRTGCPGLVFETWE